MVATNPLKSFLAEVRCGSLLLCRRGKQDITVELLLHTYPSAVGELTPRRAKDPLPVSSGRFTSRSQTNWLPVVERNAVHLATGAEVL